ncbi:MAG: aspartate aminotransferase family protein [Bauldia sp.]|nr:aspartate aminotransferase family protein [Bauldia sp.]
MSGSALFDTYARAPIAAERGEGAWLIATDGRRYLDFGSGIAVNALGHAHPALVKALTEQAAKVWHTSNAVRIPGQERLAERLAAATFADKVFFANSGAEAIECAVKTARRYHYVGGHPERNRIITFDGSFHGRTLATLSAAKNPKHTEGFDPLPDGFDQVAFGDLKAVEAAIGPATAGILIEPIQGEGGVRPVPNEFFRGLRRLCDENGLLLILDEVQTGIGRTGRLFAYEWTGVEPDILAVAKGLGGGFPVGACLATAEAARGMTAGTHGSTFGGNPLAMAVGNAVLDVVLADGFLEHVRRIGLLLKQRLAAVVDGHPNVVDEVRGEGLLIGLHCVPPNRDVLAALRDAGLIAVAAGDNVIRLLPPLIIGEAEVDQAIARLETGFASMEAGAPAPA